MTSPWRRRPRFTWPARVRLLTGVAAWLLGGASGAAAQTACNGGGSCAVVVTLRLPRPYVARLTLSQSTTTVPQPTAADFAAGFKDVAGPTLTVKANAPYRVTIQAAQSRWSYTGQAAAPNKPASALLWSGSAAGPYTSSASSSTVWPANGLAAPATAGQSIPLFYRTQWTWTTSPPGTYTLPVNLTITSP